MKPNHHSLYSIHYYNYNGMFPQSQNYTIVDKHVYLTVHHFRHQEL